MTNASTKIDVFDLPCAFELPLQCKALAGTGRHAVVVASAFVVEGGIYGMTSSPARR
jgi:6,7-dimethyl-8-ribityllumazine synthase